MAKVRLLAAVVVAAVAISAAYVLELWNHARTMVIAAGVGTAAIASLAFLSLLVSATVGFARRTVRFLGKDEQLRITGFTEATVRNGPGMVFMNPLLYREAALRKAETLLPNSYVKVKDMMCGSERIERGPQLLFPGPYEQVVTRGSAIGLSSTDYVYVENALTGERRVERGPSTFFPGPHDVVKKGSAVALSRTEYLIVTDGLTGEQALARGPCMWFPKAMETKSAKLTAIALQEDEYLRLKDVASGKRWIQRGKCLVFLEPTWTVEGATSRDPGVRKAWALKAYEYVRLIDGVTGKVVTHRGEQTVIPGPDEELLDGDVLTATDLKVHEYMKVLDQSTGEIRVECGSEGCSKQVFLGPHDHTLDGGKKKAVAIDENRAALVRDKATGQLRLVTEKQLFVPGPDETIEDVRQLIRLADHEAMILKDREGAYQYFYGAEKKRVAGQPRSFFIPPYTEVVQLLWSKGRRREERTLIIDRLDCRPQFMAFEFNCRTSDNVELVLEGTFFWEIVDVPAMVLATGDTPGDVCKHARSEFIRQVAQVTLKQFMDESHEIARRVWQGDTEFYLSRGVQIHSLEVTRYACADRRTSAILEQIIQETTNRMNRLSQAESENEVSLFSMQGKIEQEKLNSELLKIQHDHLRTQSEVDGRSDASMVSAFVGRLEESVPQLDDRLSMWQVLRKTEALSTVSQQGTTLYFTSKDVDLSIEGGLGTTAA